MNKVSVTFHNDRIVTVCKFCCLEYTNITFNNGKVVERLIMKIGKDRKITVELLNGNIQYIMKTIDHDGENATIEVLFNIDERKKKRILRDFNRDVEIILNNCATVYVRNSKHVRKRIHKV